MEYYFAIYYVLLAHLSHITLPSNAIILFASIRSP